jgi:hypothetical protein
VALAGTQAESGTVIAAFWGWNERVLIAIGCHKPYGLALVAYYCVYLAGIKRTVWYAREWVKRLFYQVEKSLNADTTFKSMLQWPKTHLATL